MTNSILNDYCSMLDRGWSGESPKKGTYTIFNLTEYSSGEAECTVTTLKDASSKARKPAKIDDLSGAKVLSEKAALKAMGFDPEPISELDKEENKQRSLRRARSVIRKKIIEGELDHFLTLTYKENKKDVAECWKDWKKFIRLVQKKYPTLKYLVIVERQKRGAIHFHVAVHGFMHVQSVRCSWLQVVGEGNIDIKRRSRNQSMHGLANYITKYLTKQYDELESFQNLYRCSKNIKLKQTKLYLPKEFAMVRASEIRQAIALYLHDVKQYWEDSNGLFSCQWASTLAP